MIFYIANHNTIFSLLVYKVTHTLSVIELRFAEFSFNIANLAVADLLDKLVCVSVEDQDPVI